MCTVEGYAECELVLSKSIDLDDLFINGYIGDF